MNNNTENAVASHGGGAKTEEGKAIVSKNAIRHGLLSKEVLLKTEDATALEELRVALMEEMAPVGTLEHIFVERMVTDVWRMRRALTVESANGFVAQESAKNEDLRDLLNGSRQGSEAAVITSPITHHATEKILRYFTTIERSFLRNLHELQRLQAGRKGEVMQLPVAVDVTMETPHDLE